MKILVVYYSHKGSNEFLAKKTAEALKADLIELRPRVRGLSILATAMHFSLGIKPVRADVSAYDRVVVIGALYLGNLSAPCSDFIRKYSGSIKKIDIITCCGSLDEKKEEKFGYQTFFTKIRGKLGDRCGECRAFPVGLVLEEELRNDDEAMMNARLNEENFTGEIKSRLDELVGVLTAV